MAGRVYIRDLEILLNLQAELGKFNYGASKVLAEVARGITDAKAFLNSRTNHWNAELHRREGALRACIAAGDRSCRAEAAAVQQAQQALEKLRKLSSRLEQAAGEYQPHANRLQQVLNSKIGKANRDLQKSINKYQEYLAPGNTSSRVGGTSRIGSGDKGKLFQANIRRGMEFEKKEVSALTPEIYQVIQTQAPTNWKGKRGRIDIKLVDLKEGFAVIMEVKASDWDKMQRKNIRPRVLSHARQLWKYINAEQSKYKQPIIPAVVYPSAPRTSGLRSEIESILGDQGIQVVWRE